jgi:hypothetical protein
MTMSQRENQHRSGGNALMIPLDAILLDQAPFAMLLANEPASGFVIRKRTAC